MRKILSVFLLFAGFISFSFGAVGRVERGREKARTCVSCHGEDMNTPLLPIYPKLAGQHYDYLIKSMEAYKNPDSLIGRRNPTMLSQMLSLSRQDIRDLAAYIASLSGELSN